jgi:hypothetical protein
MGRCYLKFNEFGLQANLNLAKLVIFGDLFRLGRFSYLAALVALAATLWLAAGCLFNFLFFTEVLAIHRNVKSSKTVSNKFK